jgi:membrane protein implicated in regulation of membrane protease activity
MELLLRLFNIIQEPGAASVFLLVALFGAILTAVRFLLLAVGIGDHDHGDMSHGDSGYFGVSVTTLGLFCLFFGLGGLIGLLQLHLNLFFSILFATSLGALSCFLVGLVMKKMLTLQSPGADLQANSFVGKHGVTNTRIEPNGAGTASLILDGVPREREVVNDTSNPMSIDTPVVVSKVVGGRLYVISSK